MKARRPPDTRVAISTRTWPSVWPRLRLVPDRRRGTRSTAPLHVAIVENKEADIPAASGAAARLRDIDCVPQRPRAHVKADRGRKLVAIDLSAHGNTSSLATAYSAARAQEPVPVGPKGGGSTGERPLDARCARHPPKGAERPVRSRRACRARPARGGRPRRTSRASRTRRVDDLVRSLGITGHQQERGQSRMCGIARRRGGGLPDALARGRAVPVPVARCDVSQGARARAGRVSMAALVAVGVAMTRRAPDPRARAQRRATTRGAPGRASCGASSSAASPVSQLVISDDHAGLVKAAREQLLGSSWQRCRVHLTRNAQGRRFPRQCLLP